MTKIFTAWAVKRSGRSFAPDLNGHPLLFKKKASAEQYAWALNHQKKPTAKCVKVNVRISETL